MKNILAYLLITLSAATTMLLTACGTDTSESLRNAEMALADGDMTAARSVADKVLGEGSLEELSATDLARLSLVYMQMSDEEADNNTLVATAADLYRRAVKANRDSAFAYYTSLPADRAPFAVQLFHIVTATDSAGVMPAEVALDSIH